MMTNDRLSQLRARLHFLEEQIRALETALPNDALRAQIGERYAQELDRLTDSEATEHLRSVDDSRVRGAYLILSERLHAAVLAEICLEYLTRPGREARLTGAYGIGSCLKRTGNRQACRALALIVRNPDEADDIRRAAYVSLELIDWGRTLPRPGASAEGIETESELGGVDWSFVDSFL